MEEVFSEFKEDALHLMKKAKEGIKKLREGFNEKIFEDVFSSLHTVKGEAGFFGLEDIARSIHSLEDELEKFRKTGKANFNGMLSEISFVETRLDSFVFSKEKSLKDVLKTLSLFAKKYSRRLGKVVETKTEIKGEIDRVPGGVTSSVETILVHILKNSVEHGIEDESEREAKGKKPRGTIIIKAEVSESNIRVTASDDGRGIDLDKLRKVTGTDSMGGIFDFAVTLKNKVDLSSGRGVGLFIVKRKVDEFGGEISFRTEKNVGTEFEIEIPWRR